MKQTRFRIGVLSLLLSCLSHTSHPIGAGISAGVAVLVVIILVASFS